LSASKFGTLQTQKMPGPPVLNYLQIAIDVLQNFRADDRIELTRVTVRPPCIADEKYIRSTRPSPRAINGNAAEVEPAIANPAS